MTLLALFAGRNIAAQTTEYKMLCSLKGDPDGAKPEGNVTLAENGTIYGTTLRGGANICDTVYGNLGCGTLFSMTPEAGRRV